MRLHREGWTSGQIPLAARRDCARPQASGMVLANFCQVLKEGELCLHPPVMKLVEAEMLEKLGKGVILWSTLTDEINNEISTCVDPTFPK